MTLATRRALSQVPPRLPPLRHRMFDWFKDDIVPRWRRMAFLYKGAGAIVLGGSLYYFSGNATSLAVQDQMVKAFENGGTIITSPPFPNDEIAKVGRPQLQKDLNALFTPVVSTSYCVVVGETGVGKSTAVRQSIRGIPEPKGVVYFDTPPVSLEMFSINLGKTVGFSTERIDLVGGIRRWLSGLTGGGEHAVPLADEPKGTWNLLEEELITTAEKFKSKHGRPPVLVIDGADLIAKHDPTFFVRLQNFAKSSADRGKLRVVFVASEGHALPLLLESSAKSRLEVYEVGDVSDKQAVEFLVEHDIPEDRANDAVKTITGGRFSLLQEYVRGFKTKTNAQFREEFRIETNTSIFECGVEKNHKFFNETVEHGVMKLDAAIHLLSKQQLSCLLSKNVLAQHPDKTYTLQSRHVERFFAKNK
eukprot:Lithocolla_globosa_v1_NODE_1945_length_2247_cov_4.583485.p1 type:complete len:419 gc:universal NODE_1945_length_2247_cov_4.583485:393-1649(+)